jgi:hypothetical protein
MNKNKLPDFEKTFVKIKGSIGEYVYDDCPQCKINGRQHTILVCRNCGAPPVASGCICDVREKNRKQEVKF